MQTPLACSVRIQVSSDYLISGIHLVPSKSNVLLPDGIGWKRNPVFAEEHVSQVNRFSCLGSFTLNGNRTPVEVSSRVQKDWLAFGNLRHHWSRRDIWLLIEGWVYRSAVRLVLLFSSKTWSSESMSSPKQWMETIDDVAQYSSHWCSCIRELNSSVCFFNLLFCHWCFTVFCSFFCLNTLWCEVTTKTRTRWRMIKGCTNENISLTVASNYLVRIRHLRTISYHWNKMHYVLGECESDWNQTLETISETW